MLGFEVDMSPIGSCFEHLVPTDGTILRGGRNLKGYGLVEESESLVAGLLRFYLVPAFTPIPVHHETVAFATCFYHQDVLTLGSESTNPRTIDS